MEACNEQGVLHGHAAHFCPKVQQMVHPLLIKKI